VNAYALLKAGEWRRVEGARLDLLPIACMLLALLALLLLVLLLILLLGLCSP
jgi:hypothetical protein